MNLNHDAPPIGREEIRSALDTLRRYKAGKLNLERRIIENEEFWKLRHWDHIPEQGTTGLKTKSAWLVNVLLSKHADAMDAYPEPVCLPRAADDEAEAKLLSRVVPVILAQNDFYGVWSDNWWKKLKAGVAIYGVFWDREKNSALGDISITRVDPLNLFWEPGITELQRSRNLFHVELADNDELVERYPILAGKLRGGSGSFSRYLWTARLTVRDASDAAVSVSDADAVYGVLVTPGVYTFRYDASAALWRGQEGQGNLAGTVFSPGEATDGMLLRVSYSYTLRRSLLRELVFMGSWVCVFPDGKYANTSKLHAGDSMRPEEDYGSIALTNLCSEGGTVFEPCGADGTAWDITWSDTAPAAGYWVDSTEAQPTVRVWSQSQSLWLEVSPYVKCAVPGIARGLRAGDSVKLSGHFDSSQGGETEVESVWCGDHILSAAYHDPGAAGRSEGTNDYLIFPGLLSDRFEIEMTWHDQSALSAARSFPEMDFVVEAGNRLWGCRCGDGVNELYGSKLGDFRNWYAFEGLSTDSYRVSRGHDGLYTGAAVLGGCPLFFREDSLEKIIPAAAGNHSVITVNLEGIERGCAKSAVVIRDKLYYKSTGGVYCYNGTLPMLAARTKHIGFGGARGGGKSWAVRTKAKLLALRYPGIKLLIVRRTYPELINNHINVLRVELLGIAKYNDKDKVLRFDNGSTIHFMYCAKDGDLDRMQGVEYDVIFLDEATQLSEYQMKTVSACLRGVNDFPKRIYYTCNPGGQGHSYIKRVFIDKRYESGEDPADYSFIQSLVTDNKILMQTQPDYIKQLEALPDKLRRAWLDGDWDIFEGQFFEDFRPSPDPARCAAAGLSPEEAKKQGRWTHVLPARAPAPGWRLYRSFDWGYSRPFSCAWWAVDFDGRLYRILELYGCTGTPNEGVKLAPDEVFRRIRETEDSHPWLRGKQIEGVADPAIWDASGGESIAETAEKFRIYFSPGDHKRIPGWMQCHYRLRFDREGLPMLYVYDSCTAFLRTIPQLVYDELRPEDLDTTGEDHVADEWRYMCMARPITPRAAPEEKRASLNWGNPLQ